MRGKPESVELFEQGIEAFKDGDYRTAIRIGRKLHSQNYTGAFELLARTYAAQGKLKKAIKELERGLQIAPTLWVLWSFLGEYYSNSGRYEDALVAFAKAESTGDDSGWALYNQAVVRWRMDENLRGLSLLEHRSHTNDDELETRALGLRLQILNELGRHNEVLEFLDDENLNERHKAELAFAYSRLGDGQKAIESLEQPDSSERTLWIVREIDNIYSPNSISWKLVVKGTRTVEFEGQDIQHGFLSTILARAATETSAFEYANKFIFDSETDLELSDATRSKRKLEGPDGVYWIASGRSWYELEEANE